MQIDKTQICEASKIINRYKVKEPKIARIKFTNPSKQKRDVLLK